MPRPTFPTRLRDHAGKEIRLPASPFATGGEGSVFEVIGHPDLVAKLYSKSQSEERCDKLHAMVKLCNPNLLKIAAWPTATLNQGDPTQVEGILMPRIIGYQEIHHLYSVAQRKKDFPEADWGFLLHTARNCAIAFESVHSHGHVVGDVNQKNVLVSKKGLVAFVDCDSFQVKDGQRIFRCGVGVPEYTPPELHGKRFSAVDRDQNHDLFGLAIMVFHLLMVGRHPFSGVPVNNADITIEQAIQQGYFAYSRFQTQLTPPPYVPPLAMLDAPTRDLFERAFRSSQRPSAAEWRAVLDQSLRGLQRCPNDPRHSFPVTGQCPWCQLIASARLMFFIPSQAAGGASLKFEAIRDLTHKLNRIQLTFRTYSRPAPQLPVTLTLPGTLSAIKKPVQSPLPPAPIPLPKPVLAPLPTPPPPPAQPPLQSLPNPPVVPIAPAYRTYPPAPLDLPHPTLHPLPPPPIHPPLPIPSPTDPFLKRLALTMSAAGILVSFLSSLAGVIVICGFGAWWLLMTLTERTRLRMAQEELRVTHREECHLMDEEYGDRVRPIHKANEKIINRWRQANAAELAKHSAVCRGIDLDNRKRITMWEAEKAAILAEDYRLTQEITLANRRILIEWEARHKTLLAQHEQERSEIELENQLLISQWKISTASQEAAYRSQCEETEKNNLRLLNDWKVANAPWIRALLKWRDQQSLAESTLLRLEQELTEHRRQLQAHFQDRRATAERMLQSHHGTLQDYEQELYQAEINSNKTQVEAYLDKSLIRDANLKGFTPDRLLALESFGIETAKDVSILRRQKVPGIGPTLSQRLFDWRDNLTRRFRSKQGLPESERQRIASRFAPALLPLTEVLQATLKELETIQESHRAAEATRLAAIAQAVQDLTVAEAHVEAMKEF